MNKSHNYQFFNYLIILCINFIINSNFNHIKDIHFRILKYNFKYHFQYIHFLLRNNYFKNHKLDIFNLNILNILLYINYLIKYKLNLSILLYTFIKYQINF